MTTITFGKHRGTALADMTDAGYLAWMLRQEDGRAADFAAWYASDIRDRVRAIRREEVERAAAETDYALNTSQATAATVIDRELLQGDRSAFRLDGGAGYGKSFVTRDIAIRARRLGYVVTAMAASYVASQVLRQQLDGLAETNTIASTCRLSKTRNEDVETYDVVPDSLERMQDLLAPGEWPKLVIVDEGSMVGDDVGIPLLEIAERTGGKLLIVGDRYQLPPVGQEHASPFYHLDAAIELDEPMRFSRDSDLYLLEQLARYSPRAIHEFELPGSNEVLLHADQRALIGQYLADTAYGDDARMLFFRREDVGQANDAIRYHRFGAEAERSPLIDGESVLVTDTTDVGRDSGTVINPDTGEAELDMGTRLYSGQTFRADHVERTAMHGVDCYVAKLHGVGRPVPLSFYGSPTATALQRKLAEIRAKVRDPDQPETWSDFYRVKNAFLPCGYPYAMTVHRCQGQTVDRVYFDPRRLQGRQGAALVYVAATRARKAVHMVR